MIGVDLLQGVVVLYLLIVNQCIYDGILEGMFYMQVFGDIWWWNYDVVGIILVVWFEIVFGFLGLILMGFDCIWVEGFFYDY